MLKKFFNFILKYNEYDKNQNLDARLWFQKILLKKKHKLI